MAIAAATTPVFSAHAEVVPFGGAAPPQVVCILRARGGSSQGSPVLETPLRILRARGGSSVSLRCVAPP